jgi:hypothetical protein
METSEPFRRGGILGTDLNAEFVAQGALQTAVDILKTDRLEPAGMDAGTFQQQLLSHLAQGGLDDEARKVQQGGAHHQARKHPGEFRIRHGLRRDHVYGTGKSRVE